MHVGFYFDTAHLQSWSWDEVLDGDVALSGTDGSVLRIAHALATSSSVTVSLLTTVAGRASSRFPASQITVPDLTGAIRYADSHRLDVLVFINAASPDVLNGIQQAEQLGQPCVVWCQNGPSRSMADRYAVSRAIRRVLCVTNSHADTYRDKSVFGKIEVVHNAIDSGWYRPPVHSARALRTACYVGALTQSKGFHHLAKAWPHVRSAVPDAQLIVAGSARLYDRSTALGPLNLGSPAYEQTYLIPHLGSSREEAADRFGVRLLGLTSPRQARALMQNATVGIVNPNLTGSLETFCVTAIEMQAAGLAVIGGRRKGLRETVRHQETGLLIDAQHELVSAIISLLTQPDQARSMGTKGQQWVKRNFDLVHALSRWERLLHAVRRGKPPSPPEFSWERATFATCLREGIRHLHALTGPNRRITVLDRWLGDIR
jgi:glycosyltransferase involved in cell wall biosynthesis